MTISYAVIIGISEFSEVEVRGQVSSGRNRTSLERVAISRTTFPTY